MLQPFADIWRQRELFRAILTRELQVRFRGSVFGWAWAVLAPLVMLSIYTLVFSGALKVGVAQDSGGRFGYAFSIFVGLIDTLGRAFLPDLLRQVLDSASASTAAPALSSMLIYLLMAIVLVLRPEGLFPAARR